MEKSYILFLYPHMQVQRIFFHSELSPKELLILQPDKPKNKSFLY